MADYPLDDKGTTYRKPDPARNIPDLNIDFMHHAGNSSGVVDGSGGDPAGFAGIRQASTA